MKALKPISGIIFLLVICMVAASVSCRRLPIQSSSIVIDSTFVEEVTRIDSVFIPGDSIPFEVLIECDSVTNKPKPKSFKAASDRAAVEFEIDSTGVLSGVSSCDSLQLLVEVKDKTITRLRKELIEKTFSVRKTSLFDRMLRYVVGVLLVLFGIIIIIIKKKIL